MNPTYDRDQAVAVLAWLDKQLARPDLDPAWRDGLVDTRDVLRDMYSTLMMGISELNSVRVWLEAVTTTLEGLPVRDRLIRSL